MPDEFEVIEATEAPIPEIEEEIPGLPPVVKVDAAPVVTPDDGVAVLRKQLDDEIKARKAAEERAEQATANATELAQREYAARTDQHETNVQLVESAIAEMKRNADILTVGLEEAYAAGDAKRAAEIQREMVETDRKINQLEDGYANLKGKVVEKPQPARQEHADPVEDFIASGGLKGKSADWIRAHPEVASDKKAFNKMIAAHHAALADDITEASPEYYAFLDKAYAPPAAKVVTEEPVLSQASKIAEAPVVAPAQRGGGNGKTTVSLTAAEREAAEASGLTLVEYAKEKMKIEREKQTGTRH